MKTVLKGLALAALLTLSIQAQNTNRTIVWTAPSQSPADTVEVWTSGILAPMGTNWAMLYSTNAWTFQGTPPPTNTVFVLWLQATNGWNVVYTAPSTGVYYTNAVTVRTNMPITVSAQQSAFFVLRYVAGNGSSPFSNAAEAAAAPSWTSDWIQ